jgi:(p)ppGpp synthase/HD superfamily hydrolase
MPSDWSQDRYIEAYLFAAEALNSKRLPGTDLPYIVHVSLVSMEVLAALQEEPGIDGDLALTCALLHDVIEDGGIKSEQLEDEFGIAVAQGVSALSKDEGIPDKPTRMRDSLRRIQQQPREVWMVKMADRITNLMTPPGHWTSRKIENYRKEAIEIHSTLKSASGFLEKRLSSRIEAYGMFSHR